MTDYTTAAQDLQWFAKRLKGVLELAPALEKMSSLENTINEATNRIQILTEMGDKLASANEEARKALEEATEAKEAILMDAAIHAQEIEDKAVEKAREAQEAIVEKASAELKKIQEDRRSLLLSIDSHQKTFEDLQAQIIHETDRLRLIKEEINNLKAKF
jgi:chromosome segregation ATPase